MPDLLWLENKLAQLQSDNFNNHIHDISGNSTNTTSSKTKSDAMQKITHSKNLWAATGKAIALQGISGVGGETLSGDEAAHALAEHWG